MKKHNSDYQGKKVEIEVAENGYIVYLNWPYGGIPAGHGKVIAETFEDAIKLIANSLGVLEDGK